MTSSTQHALVGCSRAGCGYLYVVERHHDTSACPRCETTANLDRKLPLEVDDLDAIREERGRRFAERWGCTDEWIALTADATTSELVDERGGVRHPHADWWEYRADRSVEAFFSLSGRCKSTPTRVPVDSEHRPDEDERLDAILRETQDGRGVILFLEIVRSIFDPHERSGNKNWRRLRRRCLEHPLVDNVTNDLTGEQSPDTDENRQTPSTSPLWVFTKPAIDAADAGALDPQVCEFANGKQSGPSRALSNAENALRRRRALATAAEWGDLVGAFGAHLAYHEAIPDEDRYPTRFTSVSSALDGVDRVVNSFGAARRIGATTGAMVTLTTDPSRFRHLYRAASTLVEDVRAAVSKIGRMLGIDGVPDRVTVLEPTATSALPHAHVAVFDDGAPDLPANEIRSFWRDTRRRGEQVDVTPIEVAGDRWDWSTSSLPEDANGRTPPRYMAAEPNAIAATATATADDVLELASAYRRAGDTPIGEVSVDVDLGGPTPAEVRTAAWYWATRLRSSSISRSLEA